MSFISEVQPDHLARPEMQKPRQMDGSAPGGGQLVVWGRQWEAWEHYHTTSDRQLRGFLDIPGQSDVRSQCEKILVASLQLSEMLRWTGYWTVGWLHCPVPSQWWAAGQQASTLLVGPGSTTGRGLARPLQVRLARTGRQ